MGRYHSRTESAAGLAFGTYCCLVSRFFRVEAIRLKYVALVGYASLHFAGN